jgi:hypothetical protein
MFTQGQRVTHRHSTASEWKPGVVKEVRINTLPGGRVWLANSYYVIRTDDGCEYTEDLIDAHNTFGGMVRAAEAEAA